MSEPEEGPIGNFVLAFERMRTDLREREAALTESQARFRQLFEDAPVMYVVIRHEGETPVITDCNVLFLSTLGYNREEVIGQPIAAYYTAESREAMRASNATPGQQDIPSSAERQLLSRQGRVIDVLLRAQPVIGRDGEIVGSRASYTDVSALKRAEQALALERDLLQTLLETIPDAVYVKDTASRFRRLNQATARELGAASPAEAIGKSDFDFFPEALAREYFADEQRLLDSGLPLLNKEERQSETPDGRWVMATKVPLRGPDGDVVGLVGINRDVTEQRRARAERDRLHADLEAEFQRAAEVQRLLLTHDPPGLPGYEFAASYLPARQIGGDFFDWISTSQGIRLTLGDVMGKGMPAALLMTTARAALRSVANLPVSAAVEAVNHALMADLQQSDSFVTLFCATLEPASGRLTYVDAGHGLAFVQRGSGEMVPLSPRGLPLGILANAEYPVGEITLEPGDTLVIYSDGLPDARPDLRLDPAGVAHALADLDHAQAKIDRLFSFVQDAQVRPDDLTLVIVHRLEAGS